ncbi:MAG TPA: multidrug effflux MFS transporter [Amaricoccus sp.]|uniref:multidrug effflux MFS transporter n=1 Tax=Amaricoccus sp. TaxID=1872485 RepID=UPI002CD071AF|nr:multidrug effflux MFS transporter [Amaricoccus sp.]HMQ92724.1 multidrug effflux MFS transporter [Amaricoccus sp.]HMR52533.1 multidrug effflux MFS transporter [Amaricoccus sp.]HMR60537.1 multidrug effflux MFS transporter [Amaricoccus sp.]HMT99454.1 multidrug effflux MFS transporter [Amaricoccus sp.]
MTPGFVRTAIVLGLLGAVGPFAIDMYLPAMPTIAADLGASIGATQMTLMVYFVAFGVCQLVYGPVSDMVGRRGPLFFGLTLFVLASAGCVLAPSIGALIFFRAIQGIGGSAVMVIPRAIIRDRYRGIEATRMMALVMLVISIGPMLAPLLGSGLILLWGWRAVFVAIGATAVVALVLVWKVLPETHPPERRRVVSLADMARGFRTLLTDPTFLGLTAIGGLGMASFFSFLSSSSFLYIDHFGLSPTGFSLAFSFNAIGFFTASQFAARLGAIHGIPAVIRAAVAGYAGFALVHVAIVLAGVDSLPVLMAMLFLTFANLGLVIPTAMILALEEHGPIAGIASALGGTLQMVLGAVMIALTSAVFDGTALPMVLIIAGCAGTAFLLSRRTLPAARA